MEAKNSMERWNFYNPEGLTGVAEKSLERFRERTAIISENI